MPLNRRQLLQSGAALSVAGMLPQMASAELSLGNATLTTVSDGGLVLPGGFIFEPMPQDELLPILANQGVSYERLTPECNLALYQDGTNTVLFDVGSAAPTVPRAGDD